MAKKPPKKAAAAPPKVPDHGPTLEAFGMEALCTLLRDGESYEAIARRLKMPRSVVWKWVNKDEERALAAREALTASADAIDEKAEQVLKDIPSDGTKADVARARELAAHYRWQAKARNPKVYGDKQQIGLDADTLEALSEEQCDARLRLLLTKTNATGAG